MLRHDLYPAVIYETLHNIEDWSSKVSSSWCSVRIIASVAIVGATAAHKLTKICDCTNVNRVVDIILCYSGEAICLID